MAVRKRSIIAVGALVSCSNSVLFEELMTFLMTRLKENNNTSTTTTYLQVLRMVMIASFLIMECVYFYKKNHNKLTHVKKLLNNWYH